MTADMLALTHAPSPNLDACELTHQARVPIDHALAVRQHADYCAMLRDCGAEVRKLTANLAFPDSVFIEDTAIVLDEIAMLASMGAKSRRLEPAGIEPELRRYREVVRINPPATIEGGDVLRVGRKLLVGVSSRTNRAGLGALAAIARPHGYEVVPVRVTGCLHLKSAVTALPDGSLLANPKWLDTGSLGGFAMVAVDAAEPSAANVALVDGGVCIAAAYPRTADLIRSRGFPVATADLSEFAKAEGCVTCLSLLLQD
jgi:dimethylargininase